MEPIQGWEIENVEKLLLPEGESFDLPRRTIIKNLSSTDIQACPGSGKTTVLLAKLLILSQRQPFQNGKGICVLTHTNVAIDEIKERMSHKTSVLNQYPNFFGTFQSFVDTFLAIPASIHYYQIRPNVIDADFYDQHVNKLYKKLPWSHPFNTNLYGKNKSKLDSNQLSKPEFQNIKEETFRSLRLDFVNKKILSDIADNVLFCNFNTDTGRAILDFKETVFRDGVLHYDDAYSLALRYLDDFSNILTEAFCNRFSYVFIDEMQDTDSHQNLIIEKLFTSPEIVIQKIGDMNQAIFGKIKPKGLWSPSGSSIDQSKRFHSSISNVIKNACIQAANPLVGNSNTNFCPPPTIIVFDDPKKVLPKFGQLIISHNLHREEVIKGRKNIHKAIGWVKNNDKGHLSISSYWDEFSSLTSAKREYFNNLNEYLIFNSQINPAQFKQRILNIMIRAITISGNKTVSGRSYSKSTFLSFLRNNYYEKYDELMIKVSKWLMRSLKKDDIIQDIKEYIENDLLTIFNIKLHQQELKNFVDSLNPVSVHTTGMPAQPTNLYRMKDATNNIAEVHLGTIHSVKGETHTSTLYLETYYNKQHESERLIEFLKGNYDSTLAQKSEHIKSLKMAYVGMSRPTHLLCLAVHKSRIVGHENDLNNAGWQLCDA
ncbi:MAG TPA: UvrD-helicase domain-containing protein [Cytophagales bacterium]|nr:UvrD-helicase domain-containing protein [Cytophagales bacterium]